MPVAPGVVFVTPPSVYTPPPIDIGRAHYTLWWEGWDGSNWSLSDDSSGLVLRRDVRGLGGITIEHHRDEHASLAGSRWRDFRATNREIYLPVYLFSDGTSQDWVEHNRAFTRTLRAGRTGWLHILHPDGTHRRIQARYERGLEEAYNLDPAFFGWANYGIYLTAEQPYWEAAEPITQVWRAPKPVFFFGGGDTPGPAGPPWGVSVEKTLASATITNPGDVEAWPRWIYRGAATSATVGIGDELVGIPIALTAGQSVTVDMNPYVQMATREDGTDVTSQLGTFDFSPIPPGAEVELAIDLVSSGTGSIELQLVPLYEMGVS
jgi:hypothetical protein